MATQPKRARVAAYVELVGGADHCETCLLVVVARLSSDVERTREACYAFRCGEGSSRLLGACGVSTAGLRAVCCLDAADALGAPELALNHRSAGGAALAVVCGCDDARRVAAAAVAATSPGCGADIVGAYADDHVTIAAEPGGATRRGSASSSGAAAATATPWCSSAPAPTTAPRPGSRSTGAARERREKRRAPRPSSTTGATAAAVVGAAGDYDAESPARLFARCRAEAAAAAAADDAADDAPPEQARGSSSIRSERAAAGDGAASEPGDGPAKPTKLLFLGTGSSKPSSKRGESAILVEFRGLRALFDCGAARSASCGGSWRAGAPRSAASTRSGSRTRTSTTAAACPPSSPRRWRRGDGGATPRTPPRRPLSAAAAPRSRPRSSSSPRRRGPRRAARLRRYEGDCALRELAGPAASLRWGPADSGVRVNHCRDAYAVVLAVGGARVAYSGDCRPSDAFAAAAARGFPASACEVLIHEATFDDGEVAHAVAKRHSTAYLAARAAARKRPLDGDDDPRPRPGAALARFRESAAVAPVDGGDPLAAALLAFYGARAPDRVADVARVLPLFRRNPAVMNGKLLRKYGGAPEGAARAAPPTRTPTTPTTASPPPCARPAASRRSRPRATTAFRRGPRVKFVEEFTRIPKDLSGLPHGLVVPETLRAPAHAEAHAAVARHAGRRDLGAAGRRACAARAELLRSLVAAGDLEAAVDLSLAADAATRPALPAGCVLEDRPHAGFADVVTKVQRKGMDGERISHVRLAAGEKFARVEPVGSRAFSGSMKQVPVVGFELNGTFYLAESAIHCDKAALCVGGDGAPAQLASLDEAARVSESFARRASERRLGKIKKDPFASGAMGSMKPLKANVRLPWVAVAEDEVTDYVTGAKSLLIVPVCYNDESCDESWDSLGLIASAHDGDPYAYFEEVVSVLNAYADQSSFGRVSFEATYADMVTLDTVSVGQCGSIDSINYWSGGDNAYDTLSYPVLNDAGTYGSVPEDWDYVVIMLPGCDSLSWSGIGWVSYPGTAQSVYAYDYDASVAHELGHNFGANHASYMTGGERGAGDIEDDLGASAQFLASTKMVFDWIDDDQVEWLEPYDFADGSAQCNPCGPYTLNRIDDGTLPAEGDGTVAVVALSCEAADTYFFLEHRAVETDAGALEVTITASDTAPPTVTPAPSTAAPIRSPTTESESCGSVCCDTLSGLSNTYSWSDATRIARTDDEDGYCCSEHCSFAIVEGSTTYYLQYVWSKYYITATDPCHSSGSLSYYDTFQVEDVEAACVAEPTAMPTDEPDAVPVPTAPQPTPYAPTKTPTAEPSPKPTSNPSYGPTAMPTVFVGDPTRTPVSAPTPAPSAVPSYACGEGQHLYWLQKGPSESADEWEAATIKAFVGDGIGLGDQANTLYDLTPGEHSAGGKRQYLCFPNACITLSIDFGMEEDMPDEDAYIRFGSETGETTTFYFSEDAAVDTLFTFVICFADGAFGNVPTGFPSVMPAPLPTPEHTLAPTPHPTPRPTPRPTLYPTLQPSDRRIIEEPAPTPVPTTTPAPSSFVCEDSATPVPRRTSWYTKKSKNTCEKYVAKKAKNCKKTDDFDVKARSARGVRRRARARNAPPQVACALTCGECTPPPSPYPSSAPTVTLMPTTPADDCADSTSWYCASPAPHKKSKDTCEDYVAKKSKNCKKYGFDGTQAKYACPALCGECEVEVDDAACADSTSWYYKKSQDLCGNQPVSWDVGAKLQNSLARSNRSRFG
ncbi:3'-tRNA processing endoribonuclease [Aureococcus anophagefferens]|nr:3'-tRNA processing endoribonuclease [Aureococcus anophagefferens]